LHLNYKDSLGSLFDNLG